MELKEKSKVRNFQKYWKKQGRKKLFTWVHRYLRLHSELLNDSVYKNMYDYHRNTLIAYFKNDKENREDDELKLGEVVDVLADIFNKNGAKQVNKYKPIVEKLYLFWRKNPNTINEIRI